MTSPEITAAIAALESIIAQSGRGAVYLARPALAGLKQLAETQNYGAELIKGQPLPKPPFNQSAGEGVGTVAGTSASSNSAPSEAGTAAPPADTSASGHDTVARAMQIVGPGELLDLPNRIAVALAAAEKRGAEREREANSSLWPCAPGGVSHEWENGFVSGLRAFREAIRSRSHEIEAGK